MLHVTWLLWTWLDRKELPMFKKTEELSCLLEYCTYFSFVGLRAKLAVPAVVRHSKVEASNILPLSKHALPADRTVSLQQS